LGVKTSQQVVGDQVGDALPENMDLAEDHRGENALHQPTCPLIWE
jgi:hypothetical protein